MKLRKLLLTAVLQLLVLLGVQAQQKEVSGKVLDAATGEALSGVSILSDKKASPAVSAADGTFKLQVVPGAKTIIVSYVGYTTQTIAIGSQSTIEVRLQRNTKAMDEVVVIGYGTQRKSHLTGAVSKYQNEKLDEAPVSRVDQALQGRIAGVQVQNISSEAGSDTKIRVRGQTSINANSEPLVVVDGHPVDGFSFVNPADVQSIEVLKDAASAAIYGSRGSAGVILITTKAGKAGKTKYNVKFSTGVKQAYKTYDVMTSTEYANLLYYEASLRSKDPLWTGNTNLIANNERAAYVLENEIVGFSTDWQQEALRNANVTNVQLNVSGGSNAVRYFLSGGFQRDQGLMYHSEYDKYNVRARMDADLSKRVKVSLNLNPSYIRREQPSVNFMDFVRFYSYLPVIHNDRTAAFANGLPQWANVKPGDFVQARHFNGRPYSGTMPDGTFWSTTSNIDPFSTSNNTPKSIMENATDITSNYRMLTSADLTVNIIPGLDFKTSGSVYVNYVNRVRYDNRGARAEGSTNRGVFNDNTVVDLLSENTLSYNRRFGKHSINAVAGFTTERNTSNIRQITGSDFPNDKIPSIASATVIDRTATFDAKDRWGLNSVLGRVSYSFKDRYLASVSLRSDGSSFFAPGRKWGTFPAVSLGWVASQEKFMENLRAVSNLKFRGSYGATGNNRIVPFAYLDLLVPTSYPLGAGTGTVNPGQIATPGVLANPDITWERTFSFNGGMDLGLFANRVTLSLDMYQSKTESLLLKQSTLGITGATQVWNNVGRLQNTGIEAELSVGIINRKGIRWTATGNIARNRNKLLELDGQPFFASVGERDDNYRNIIGSPLVQYWGYKTDGVFRSQAEADSLKAAGYSTQLSTSYFSAGGIKIADINGDKKIDANDRTVIGNPYPDFNWGLQNNITFGNFDVSFLLQGSQGGQLVNGDAGYNETKRTNRAYTANRWISPGNPGDGKTPYFTNGNISWVATDIMVEDASFWAVRELIVGYTLPSKLTKAIKLSSARFYFTAQNMYYHFASGYRGINPEARTTGGTYDTPLIDGYQRGGFPLPKTFLFGVDVNF
ncbi:TonB-dependent receptor [Flaviaesturariibacter flavus]|uniref:TonB-dependent receptor n=1 Tax=Flaviaesturariibacter flavus TaxID=2502780 RepID=A0A4R1BK03_9BACT|nr:TonB-dependent receptor [Flaviaesturariibacter flavus]TCJ17690.1 TonB-dependent receptor [Flaviaesturariibacter flavus]